MTPEPVSKVIVFAGPNGSGKSTITEGLLIGFDGEYINADAMAKELEPRIPDYLERNLIAADLANDRRQEAISQGRPFAFETVFSTAGKLAIMTQAKAAGYEVGLVFVTTRDPEINVQRVANRVEEGGHSVAPDKIRSRYHGAMGLLPAGVEVADIAAIYDNSLASERIVAIKRAGQLQLQPDAHQVPWVQDKLWTPYQARETSLQAIQQAYQADVERNPTALPCSQARADASDGKRYAGRIVGLTEHHALQQIGANVYKLHDRLLVPATPLELGKHATIQYAYSKGHVVTPDLAKPGPGKQLGR
ncbi:putative ABC-type ATPase [Massilia sp. MP_M2]|uniref:KfrB domain-containing protein n=1 Tax=Massilia sp. MP_M2 TaxID=3071713 RepID=UPI00319EABEF